MLIDDRCTPNHHNSPVRHIYHTTIVHWMISILPDTQSLHLHGWSYISLPPYYHLVINIIFIIIIYQYHSPNIGHRMIRIPPDEAIFTSAKAPPCSSHTLLFISSRLFHHHHQNLCFHHHHHLHCARKIADLFVTTMERDEVVSVMCVYVYVIIYEELLLGVHTLHTHW